MRRTIVVGALSGLCLVGGAPVALAAPEISARSCEADGGTFSRDRGVKTCTTTTGPVETADGDPVVRYGVPGPFDPTYYIGVVQPTRIVTTTTTTSQRGNGEVSTTTDETVTAGVHRECYEVRYVIPTGPETRPADLEECETRGLFG